jgi:hypothetical protein
LPYCVYQILQSFYQFISLISLNKAIEIPNEARNLTQEEETMLKEFEVIFILLVYDEITILERVLLPCLLIVY